MQDAAQILGYFSAFADCRGRSTLGARDKRSGNPEKNLDYYRLAGNKRFVHVLDE